MSKDFQSRSYIMFRPRTAVLPGLKVISRSGAVLLDRKWTLRSMYSNPIVALKTLAISLISIAKRGVVHVMSDKQYGFIHSIWTAGYYHWLTESLPRALVMQEKFPDAVPMMPQGRYENYTQSLTALGFREIAFFPEGKNVLITAPVVTECARTFSTTDPTLLRAVRQRVFKYTNVAATPRPSKLVYVSRSKSRGRFIINEDEIINVLNEFHAESINFEDFHFLDQVRLMAETHTLVSIHGAALTNMMFMPEGGNVIEIIPKKNFLFDYNYVRNSTRHDPCYMRLADAMGHEYKYLQGKPKIDFFQNTHMANIWVDPSLLRELLEIQLSKQ